MYRVSESVAFGGLQERRQLSDDEQQEWTIINVSSSAVGEPETHIPLADGNDENTQQVFASAVNEVRDALTNSEKVFVHCAVGQSRSVIILATSLAVEQHRELDEVLTDLQALRNTDTDPMPSLRTKAERYLRHAK